MIPPGQHLGVLLEQGAALPLGHATPDSELDAVVQRVSQTIADHRTVPAYHRSFALSSATNEQLVGISGSTHCLGHPRDPALVLHPAHHSAGR